MFLIYSHVVMLSSWEEYAVSNFFFLKNAGNLRAFFFLVVFVSMSMSAMLWA